MRREFILVLLGIICTSTLSSLLNNYVQTNTNKVLLDTVVGVVGAGNFSYWQLGHSGPLLVELTSLKGDADLYVSDNLRPSFEVDKNNFSSTTCGPDLVSIPTDFPRPIGIGVFGYWSTSQSEYSIQVFLENGQDEQHFEEHASQKSEWSDADKKRGREKSRSTEEDSKPRFLKLLNVLDMIFEMFIL